MKNKIDYKSIYIYINKQKSNNNFEFGERKTLTISNALLLFNFIFESKAFHGSKAFLETNQFP